MTCPENRAICSACSIACHTNHEQVELCVLHTYSLFRTSSSLHLRFPKRNFRCDCPTTAISNQCTLHTKLEDENTTNVYGQNFKGSFCRCGRPYDAKTERETMIQCLVCEVRPSNVFCHTCILLKYHVGLVSRIMLQPSRTTEFKRADSCCYRTTRRQCFRRIIFRFTSSLNFRRRL